MNSLRNHFLVAMPSLSESVFSHSITYICDHTEDGAMGLIINQPLKLTLDEVFTQLGFKAANIDQAVLSGGPVETERGFVLHDAQSAWGSTMPVTDEISLTASKDVLRAISQGEGPEKYQVMLGYAGWGGGQLEEEISNNAWLTVEADSAIIFDTAPDQRWSRVASNLGIDLNLLTATAGHA